MHAETPSQGQITPGFDKEAVGVTDHVLLLVNAVSRALRFAVWSAQRVQAL